MAEPIGLQMPKEEANQHEADDHLQPDEATFAAEPPGRCEQDFRAPLVVNAGRAGREIRVDVGDLHAARVREHRGRTAGAPKIGIGDGLRRDERSGGDGEGPHPRVPRSNAVTVHEPRSGRGRAGTAQLAVSHTRPAPASVVTLRRGTCVISSSFASSAAKPHCSGSKKPHSSCAGFAGFARFFGVSVHVGDGGAPESGRGSRDRHRDRFGARSRDRRLGALGAQPFHILT